MSLQVTPGAEAPEPEGKSRSAARPGRRYAVPAVISCAVLVLLGAGALAIRRAEGQVNKVALASQPKPVATVRAHKTSYRATRRYVGTLKPWLKAGVGPQLASGFIASVLVRPGDEVKRGAVLATLDCRNASTASKAIALEARALETRQRASAKEVARLEQMLQGGYAADNEIEQRVAQNEASATHIESLMARLQGKQLEESDCVLRAPFAGEIAERLYDPGAFVRPGAAIVTVVDREIVRLAADVPEADFQIVAPGSEARIQMLSSGQTLTSRISRRSPAADEETRTIHVEVDLSDMHHQIPVGTTALLEMDVGGPKPALQLPLQAATIRGDRATLWLVEAGHAKKAQVDVLGESGGSLFIEPSLPEGALIVTQGRSLLSANDRVVAKKVETAL
jgi:RND family efflux transporter MFP subunit